jgi:hypothetical protein
MRKFTSIISISLTLIGLFSVSLTRYSHFFSDYYLRIVAISLILSLILALISEKGLWKKIALWFIAIVVLLFILFFIIMGVFWNEP